MRRPASAIIGFILAGNLCAQTCHMDAIEKQQRELTKRVTSARSDFQSIWAGVYPNGAPFQTENDYSDRKAAWAPKYKIEKGVIAFNTGLGCIVFITPKDSPAIPDLCGPVDLQANLAMEALLEDWDNLQHASSHGQNQNAFPFGLRDEILTLWTEEKTLYCALQPNSMYIGLSGTSAICTHP